MSKITGKEPKHWHDENGKHRMPDPRRKYAGKLFNGNPTTGTPRRHWEGDERAYADHLEAHELSHVERQEDDSAAVSALFDKLEGNDRESRALRELITALRNSGQ